MFLEGENSVKINKRWENIPQKSIFDVIICSFMESVRIPGIIVARILVPRKYCIKLQFIWKEFLFSIVINLPVVSWPSVYLVLTSFTAAAGLLLLSLSSKSISLFPLGLPLTLLTNILTVINSSSASFFFLIIP